MNYPVIQFSDSDDKLTERKLQLGTSNLLAIEIVMMGVRVTAFIILALFCLASATRLNAKRRENVLVRLATPYNTTQKTHKVLIDRKFVLKSVQIYVQLRGEGGKLLIQSSLQRHMHTMLYTMTLYWYYPLFMGCLFSVKL